MKEDIDNIEEADKAVDSSEDAMVEIIEENIEEDQALEEVAEAMEDSVHQDHESTKSSGHQEAALIDHHVPMNDDESVLSVSVMFIYFIVLLTLTYYIVR